MANSTRLWLNQLVDAVNASDPSHKVLALSLPLVSGLVFAMLLRRNES